MSPPYRGPVDRFAETPVPGTEMGRRINISRPGLPDRAQPCPVTAQARGDQNQQVIMPGAWEDEPISSTCEDIEIAFH